MAYDLLLKTLDNKKVKAFLREGPEEEVAETAVAEEPNENQEASKVVENELATALKGQASALLDKPYVEKQSKADFLVIKDDVADPFVTVIPNAIYYNIEKKCVNWLDNCSLDGIRAKLFQAIRSPYK